MNRTDCIYPDCQIRGEWLGSTCEHSCPFEDEAKEERRQWLENNSQFGVGA